MNRTVIVFLLSGLVLLAAALYRLHNRSNEIAKTPNVVAISGMPASRPKFDVSIVPTINRPRSTHHDLLQKKITYQQFTEQKTCFDIQQTAPSILDEIASLKVGMQNTQPDMKLNFVHEIERKEAQLANINKCAEQGRSLSEVDLSNTLRAAAESGDVTAQLAYSKNPLIDPSTSIARLDDLKAWRDSALTYVNAAVKAGNADAMVVLAGAYDPFRCQASNEPECSDMLAHLVDQNAEQAYRYYYQSLTTSHAPPWVSIELGALERLLTSDQVTAARAAARVPAS